MSRDEKKGAIEIKGTSADGKAQTAMQASLTNDKQSALQKYRDIVIGSDSVWQLIKYELMTMLLGPIPGALGLVLRKKLYPKLFKKVGRNVIFGKSVTIRHPGKISLGNNCVLDDYAVLDAKGESNSGISIGDNVIIGRNTSISCKNGDISIGDNSNIATNCFIQSAQKVEIGKNVLFAAYCYVIGGGDHAYDRTDIPIMSQGQIVRGITIADDCWLGAAVLVQDGVHISNGSIIGSGAVVTKNLPSYAIAAGVPAKVIGSREQQQDK